MQGSDLEEQVILDLNDFEKAQHLFRAALSNDYKLIAYGGAIRGGKSYNVLGALVLLLRMYPGARAAIVRKDLPTLRTNTLPTCEKVFPSSLQLVNATTYKWEFPRVGSKPPSTIFFFPEGIKSDKELRRWDGLEVNYIFIDQLEEVHSKTLTKAIMRAGAYFIPSVPPHNQPKPKVFATLNPAQNWVKRKIYIPYQKDELPKGWIYIPAKLTDNPHVPQSYKDQLEDIRELDPLEYDRMVEGNWDYMDDGSMLYDLDAIGDIFENSFISLTASPANRYITADIAFDGNDSFVVLVWDGWRVIDILVLDKTEDTKVVEQEIRRLAELHHVPRSHIVFDGAGSGYYLKGYLKGARSFVGSSSPVPLGKAQRAATNDPRDLKKKYIVPQFRNLRCQAYYMIRPIINGYKMYIPADGELRERIEKELEAIRKLEGDKLAIIPKKEIKDLIGHSPDFADCISMRWYAGLHRSKKPKFKTHG